MPSFEYQAVNTKGKNIKGTIDADNLRVARQKLREKGIDVPAEIIGMEEMVEYLCQYK